MRALVNIIARIIGWSRVTVGPKDRTPVSGCLFARRAMVFSQNCFGPLLAVLLLAAPAAAENPCLRIDEMLSFCDAGGDWTLKRPAGKGGDGSAIFVHEPSGIGASLANLPVSNYPDISVRIHHDWLKMSVDPKFDGPPVLLEREAERLGNEPAETVIYQVSMGGNLAVMATTYQFGKKRVISASTFLRGKTYSSRHRARHADFLEAVRYKEDT